MKNKKKLLVVFVIILTFLQSIVYYKSKKTIKNEIKQEVSVDLKEDILIKDVDNYMKILKNYKIISRVKDVNGWIVHVKVTGTKSDVIYNLNKLEKFILKGYSINFNKDIYELEMDLQIR